MRVAVAMTISTHALVGSLDWMAAVHSRKPSGAEYCHCIMLLPGGGEMHWLSISYQVMFKIQVLVYKASLSLGLGCLDTHVSLHSAREGIL